MHIYIMYIPTTDVQLKLQTSYHSQPAREGRKNIRIKRVVVHEFPVYVLRGKKQELKRGEQKTNEKNNW